MLSSWKDAGEEAATPAEGFASSSFLTTEAAEVVEEEAPAPKRRGRPPKNPPKAAAETSTDTKQSYAQDEAWKRKASVGA